MKTIEDYPGVTSFNDRHGKRRYRYRVKGRSKSLPGNPGENAFDIAYTAVTVGREATPATVTIISSLAKPETLGAAWRLAVKTAEWKILGRSTKSKAIAIAEKFLSSKVNDDPDSPDKEAVWSGIPVRDVKRKHIKHILSERAMTPHAAKQVLIMIRKMIKVALDEEWIENDPTYRIVWRPKYGTFRAWKTDELTMFMNHWAPGSTARTVFSIALWLGIRRVDIPNLEWSNVNFVRKRVYTRIIKGDKEANLKLSDRLIEDLSAINDRGVYVLETSKGRPYSYKSLTELMRGWTKDAGLPSGCTIHGLRKTLGKLAAEGGATTKMSMGLLTHSNMAHAELYSREANEENLAAEALDCAVIAFDRNLANQFG